MRKRLTMALAVGVLMAAMVPAIASGADGQGNSASAKACQKGGWMSVQTGTGITFANQGACVSYGAKGGTLLDPRLTLHCTPHWFPRVANDSGISWTGTGFTPNSTGTAHTEAVAEYTWTVATDASGAVAFAGYDPAFDKSIISAYPGMTTFAEFTDVNGVHASLTATSC